jgi:hypothetical protein
VDDLDLHIGCLAAQGVLGRCVHPNFLGGINSAVQIVDLAKLFRLMFFFEFDPEHIVLKSDMYMILIDVNIIKLGIELDKFQSLSEGQIDGGLF